MQPTALKASSLTTTEELVRTRVDSASSSTMPMTPSPMPAGAGAYSHSAFIRIGLQKVMRAPAAAACRRGMVAFGPPKL